MEYVSLYNQQNTYPSVESYKKTALDEISLYGVYPQNIKKFQIPKLSDLKVVKGTSFKFLLNVAISPQSESLGLYTSPLFYTELVTSINESNPYFINNAFIPEYTVNYYINSVDTFVSKSLSEFNSNNINIDKNVFIRKDGTYDIESLVKYIDWVVSSPKIEEVEEGNVIPAKMLSSYTLPETKIKDKPTPTQALEVGEETIQINEYRYIRRRNLNREPKPVRKFPSSYNVTETNNPTLYLIREDETFYADKLYSGWYRVFDNQRTAPVGYVDIPNDRVQYVSGPFYVTIKTVNSSNTNTSQTTTTTPSGGGGGGGGNMRPDRNTFNR